MKTAAEVEKEFKADLKALLEKWDFVDRGGRFCADITAEINHHREIKQMIYIPEIPDVREGAEFKVGTSDMIESTDL